LVEKAETWDFALLGDAGQTTLGSEVVRSSVHRQGVSRLVLLGDNLYEGTYEAVWAPWKALGMTFDMVALGNHLLSQAEEMKFFQMDNDYYTNRVGTSQFIVLNSEIAPSRVPDQAEWLRAQLGATQASAVFLVYHRPSYTVSSVHDWKEQEAFQRSVRPLIWAYRSKITALLVGHDHLASMIHVDGLPMLLSGAVKEVRMDKKIDRMDKDSGHQVKVEWYFTPTAHWAKLHLETGKAPVAEFIRAHDDHVACTVHLPRGKAAVLEENCRL